MDKYVSGFISGFERRYSRLERVIKHTLTRTVLQSPARKKKAAAAAALAAAEKQQKAAGRKQLKAA